MSSFICEESHFGAVCHFVTTKAMFGMESYRVCNYKLRDAYPALWDANGLSKRSFEATQKEIHSIFDTLYALQITCVSLQYQHHEPEGTDIWKEIKESISFHLPEYKLRKHNKPISKEQAVKALACIDYQIEVCHLEKVRPLTDNEKNAILWLELFTNDLSSFIVTELPAYKDAVWHVG